MYVADRQNNRISVFRKNGQFSGTIGQQHLSQCFDISVDHDIDKYFELVVADWRHHCIYTFTLDGEWTNTFTTKAAGSVQLKTLCSVTTDSDGVIFITDTCNHTVLIFDEFRFMYCFGSQGSDDGELNYPHGIAIAPNGSIYVSDTRNRRIQFFLIYIYIYMLNKNTWGVKKCGANQKQHCKQAGATKRFDIS